MDRQEGGAAARHLPDRRGDRRGDIVELEVREDPFVIGKQPIQQFEVATRGHQLQPDLVELDGVAQFPDQGFGGIGPGYVEGDNQALAWRDGRAGNDGFGHGRHSPSFGSVLHPARSA